MNTQELKVGNWVRHSQNWSYRNEDLAEFDFQFTESDWYAIGECTLFIEDLKPIPLTEEWLVKFGFEQRKPSSGKCFYQLGIEPWGPMNIYDLERVALSLRNITKIKRVHQLQNLYFALSGEELIIK